MDYKFIQNLAAEVTIPQDGILSRTLHNDDRLRVVVFGFAAGQELTEHTSKMPAVLHVLEGQARLKLGDQEHDAAAGTFVAMPPELPHGIHARTPLILLLLLMKGV